MKTRSPLYMRQLSDKVHAKLDSHATSEGLAKWLLVEKILEKYFNIKDDGLNLAEFIGINKNSARIGLPYKKKVTK
jgi:hypothetical protein